MNRHSFRLSVFLFVLSSVPARAQDAVDNGVPMPITVQTTMDNNFSVDVTDIDFGTIAVTSAPGEAGELIMDTDGTFDEATGNTDPVARIAARSGAGQPGILDISSSLPDTLLTVRYENVGNLVCVAGCLGANPEIVVSRIGDDMANQAGEWSIDDGNPDADATPGQAMTNGSGELTVNIGASLRTEDTNDRYQSGDYEGSFDVVLEY
jgi:hypothetical protein